ncbi:Protein cappuccino, partial [Eumeta japonica]
EIDETKLDNIEEFTDLFSRQVVKAPVKKKIEVKTKIKPVKILDSKRSQNVGILAQSLHVEFSEIENAIYNFDTSVISLEALQQIYELRATDEELAEIKRHLEEKKGVSLDRPEAFLHDLSSIPNFAERISCFMFQAEFEDAISTTMHKLDNLKHTCEFLMKNESLKKLFAIILTLGNYMNGGNGQRGQADGFGLEILSKLKDVKSKQSNITLLHFIVRTYLRACGGVLSAECALPVPEPGDVTRAAALDFGDVSTQLQHLSTQLDKCRKTTELVIENDPVTRGEVTTPETSKRLEVFKEKMNTFLNTAEEKLKMENENLEDCRNKFITTVKFYQYTPKGVKPEECEPKDFFCLWTSFCSDFKDMYKKEEQNAMKEKLKETKKQQEERKSLTQPKKEGGLKSRLQKLSSSKK